MIPISMTKRPKKSNPFKAGSANSKYRLYVEFLPGYDHPRKSFNYFSNDRKGSDKGLDDLLRRVLNGTCRGRYKKAMLYDVPTKTCLRVYAPQFGEMSYRDYVAVASSLKPKQPLLKAFIICLPSYIDELIRNKKRHPIILDSIDVDTKTNKYGKDVATFNFRELLTKGKLKGKFSHAFLYDQSNNRKVTKFNHEGSLTFFDDEFKIALLCSPNYQLKDLGIFIY